MEILWCRRCNRAGRARQKGWGTCLGLAAAVGAQAVGEQALGVRVVQPQRLRRRRPHDALKLRHLRHQSHVTLLAELALPTRMLHQDPNVSM